VGYGELPFLERYTSVARCFPNAGKKNKKVETVSDVMYRMNTNDLSSVNICFERTPKTHRIKPHDWKGKV
jgi:hypothetical protein